jgi:phosphoribosylanthranilate isomerase
LGIVAKICGLTRREDAELALELGAFAVGFVFEKTSPRYVGSQDWAPNWLDELGGMHVAVFGIAPSRHPGPLFDAVQAAEWPSEELPDSAIQSWERIKVARLVGEEAELVAVELSRTAPFLLIDAHSPNAYGGTGQTVDWDLASRVVALARAANRDNPIFKVGLAGGLTPENVARAVEIVRPDYVDVSSGIEQSPGIKSPEKLRAFFAALG